MTGGFPVGTVCIGQNFIRYAERNGMECVVIGGLELRTAPVAGMGDIKTSWSYRVEWADGTRSVQQPHYLRRKQPPSGELAILRMFDLTAPAPREVETA